MNRRDFLTLAGFSALFPSGLIWPSKKSQLFGWKAGHKSRLSPFGKRAKHLRHFGEGKVACLWKPYQEVVGREWLAHNQVIGNCVGHAVASGMDLLSTKQISVQRAKGEAKETWVAPSSIDIIYSGGRNHIANYKLRGDGAQGIWCVKWVNEYGNLLRIPYEPFDLSPYTKETARYWDRKGVPESLQLEAKEHPLLDYAPVQSASEAADAIAAGFPVVICSGMGLNRTKRDAEGFVKPSGRWSHAMLLGGIDQKYTKRPGFLVINSHGDSFSGPTRHDQPSGCSVWVDYDIIDYYLRRSGDSYSISNFVGFPCPENPYILW